MLEKTLESPLDCKIKPVTPKGNQSWIFIGRTEVEAETPILWLPDIKNWLLGKDTDLGKDWRQEDRGTTEDEMVGWHQWLDGHEFEWTPGAGGGQGGLMCCSPRCHKESDTTEWLNWTDRFWVITFCCHLFLGMFLISPLHLPEIASAWNAGDLALIPGSGRSPGEGNGNPLQHSCLENPMDGGA